MENVSQGTQSKNQSPNTQPQNTWNRQYTHGVRMNKARTENVSQGTQSKTSQHTHSYAYYILFR